jgi:hypothetical protein
MTFGEGPDGNGFDYEDDREAPEFEFPIVASDSEKALADLHGRAESDYESWKREFLILSDRMFASHSSRKPRLSTIFLSRRLSLVHVLLSDGMNWLYYVFYQPGHDGTTDGETAVEQGR